MKINIRTMLMTVLMLVTLVVISVMGFLLYQRFKISLDETTVSSTQAAVESTVDRLNSDFSAIRQLLMQPTIILFKKMIFPARNLQTS